MVRYSFVLVLAFAVVLTGCSNSRTVTTPGGSATVTESGGETTTTYKDNQGNTVESTTDGEDYTATVTDAEGNTSTYEASADGDFSETGLTPYPSTFKVDGKTIVNTAKQGEITGTTAVAFTKDSPEKAVAHFKDQLDKVESEFSAGTTHTVTGHKGDRQVSVSITKEEEGTQIFVMSFVDPEK